jgi:arabinogalactan oligomer / maltooligosaccharide transport system permease protein
MTTTGSGLPATAGTLRRRREGPPSLWGRFRYSLDRWWLAYAMLLPVFVVMAVLVFYPLGRGIYLSFTNADQFNLGGKDLPSSYTWIGLDNYKTIFESAEFKSVGWFTVIWTFVNVFFHVTLGLILALVLNRTLRLRGMYRLLLLIPWAVPSFISAFTFRFLFNSPYGFFAQILQKLGMSPEQVPAFLSDPFWAKVVVITANVWAGVPFMMVALLGGLQAIDRDLIDAAAVDGSNAWQRFWNVTLPGLRPVAATVTLLGLIWTFNSFNYIYLITAGGPGNSTDIFATFSYKYAFEYRLYGGAAAYGVIILSILLVFSQFYRAAIRRTGEETWS